MIHTGNANALVRLPQSVEHYVVRTVYLQYEKETGFSRPIVNTHVICKCIHIYMLWLINLLQAHRQ